MFMVPLHPCKTSMPSTCSIHNTTHKLSIMPSKELPILKRTSIRQTQHIILRLFSPLNIDDLQHLIEESIEHLRNEFYNSKSTIEIEKLLTLSRKSSHTNKLCIFFLLLNIDQKMKECLITMDGTLNDRKLVRFFADLKKYAVPAFFATEKLSPSQFVEQCEELYVIG